MKLTIFLLLFSQWLYGQEQDIDRLMQNELKMTFPGVYFEHGTAEYAHMPYTSDSCFKYIAANFDKTRNSLVLWRDSSETEELTLQRIKKLNQVLKSYLKSSRFTIQSMEDLQKVSQRTIRMTTDGAKADYLRNLNSVLDISKTRVHPVPIKSHMLRPKIWCWSCWKNGFHLNKRGRDYRKMVRQMKQK